MADPFNPDPSIPLQAGAGLQQTANPMMGNPVSTMTGFAQVQNLLNQNRLFQQTFAARQRLGEIMAQSPDLDTAMATASRDPIAGPFAPEVMNSVRQMDFTMLQMQGEQQKQAQSGMEGVFKALPAIYSNPTNQQWQTSMQAALAPLSPTAQQRVAPYIESLRQGLMDNLPADSQAAAPMLRQRLNAMMLSSNITPEMLRQTTGQVAPQFQTVQGAQGQQIPGVVSGTGQFNPLSGPPMAGAAGPMSGTAPTGTTNTAPSLLAGSPGTLIGPTTTASAEMAATGKAGGDINTEMANRAEQLPGAIKRLDIMSGTLGQFQAGGLATWRARVGQLMQGLRNAGADWITPSLINNVSNSSLPAQQLFESQVKPFVINQLKQAAAGTGKVMRSEVDAFLQMADPNVDPAALGSILNQARYGVQVDYDRTQKWLQFKQQGGHDLADFEPYYISQFDPSKLPDKTGGGLQLGPTPVSSIKGASLQQPSATPSPAAAAPDPSKATATKNLGGKSYYKIGNQWYSQ